MVIYGFLIALINLLLIFNIISDNGDPPLIYLSINARSRNIEINWFNLFPKNDTDNTLLILNSPAPKLERAEYNFTYK